MSGIRNTAILTALVAASVSATGANADVVISSAATQSMSCADGVCAPTAADAVLNTGDLETLLASGSVTVTTTGSGVQADNVDVNAALSWSSTSTLTLDAHESIAIGEPVSVTGEGALSLLTNDGGSKGTLSFGDKGDASFANLSSPLTIDGTPYTLVGGVKALAAAIQSNPSGDYALASNYNAAGDGTYSASPVPTALTGTVEGLGNAVSNLSIAVAADNAKVGLFSDVGAGGAVDDLRLTAINIDVSGRGGSVGGLAGENDGTLSGDVVEGKVNGGTFSKADGTGAVGGLVGVIYGTINNSRAAVSVVGKSLGAGGLIGWGEQYSAINDSYATGNVTVKGEDGSGGGLAGVTLGAISECFATGKIKGGRGDRDRGIYGGLVGSGQTGTISNSYSTGSVTQNGHGEGAAGGFVGGDGYGGKAGGSIISSYSTGSVAGANFVGGFAGSVINSGAATDDYWDTTTSGTDKGVGEGPPAGISGLTTQQLQSGLPKGFDRKIWGEKHNINNGLPYLLANPPPK